MKEYKIVVVTNKLNKIVKYLFHSILLFNFIISIYLFINDVSIYFGKSLISLVILGAIFSVILRKSNVIKVLGDFQISKNDIIINIDGNLYQKNNLKDFIILIDGYTNQITFLYDSFLISKGFENKISFTLSTNKHFEYFFIIKNKEDFEFINECELIYLS
ncbi:MAG: hypothetical protein KFKLKKLM_00330 [Flavobacteriales bacterium]|nr:hypothetical protein [Flavobacteriales bacterium]MBV6483871.1 hypothetical protein [Flavobacteriales bacterium]MCL4857652.1 hypothetical protein [Flavobacteriales bacterium]